MSAAALASTVSADGYTPGEPYSTLTPTATYNCGATDYTSSFGIAVQTIGSGNAKRDAISQIADGQVQATSVSGSQTAATSTATTESGVAQATDGQIQQKTSSGSTTILTPSSTSPSTSTSSSSSSSACATSAISIGASSCKNSGTLEISLNGGVLTDAEGRIGSIVSNRQFQFDGPPPQAGAIYAGGWSVTPAGNLALGDSDIFYQCLSGSFYNLYDESIGSQCHEIHLEVVSLVDC